MTPHGSYYSPTSSQHDQSESGSSAGTVRKSLAGVASQNSHSPTSFTIKLDRSVSSASWSMVDAVGADRDQRGGGGSSYRGGRRESDDDRFGGRREDIGRRGGGGDRNYGSGRGGPGGGAGDGRDEDDDRGGVRSAFSSTSESEGSSEEEESDDENKDKYGRVVSSPDMMRSPQRSRADRTRASSPDDDVPLAQRIPTALSAQATIRRRVRDEREARRKDRAQRTSEGRSFRGRATTRSPPRVTNASGQHKPPTSSRPAKRSVDPKFAVEDLTQKLLNVQASDSLPSVLSTRPAPPSHAPVMRDPPGRLRSATTVGRPSAQGPEVLQMWPMHKADGRHPELSQSLPKASSSSEHPMSPRLAHSRPRRYDEATPLRQRPSQQKATTDEASRPQHANERFTRTWNIEGHTSDGSRYPRGRASSSARNSADLSPMGIPPPLPPLPPIEVLASFKTPPAPPPQALPPAQVSIKGPVVHQRVFIGDKERSDVVDVGPSTSAREVLDVLNGKAQLNELSGEGGCMLWEVVQDSGMGKSCLLPFP
jgi:hypothetical protein